MEGGQYIRTLAEFVTGDINVSAFRQFVDDRLFELRQNSEMTDEKRTLSSIELYLHEAEEGLRDKSEVYACAQSILDTIVLQTLKSEDINRLADLPVVTKMPYFLSKTLDVDIKQSDTEQKEFEMAASI